LDVLWHNGDTLGVDGAQVSVLKEADQVGLTGFLEGSDGSALEPEISFEVLSNFSDQPLEGQFADEKLSGFLVATNFTKSHGTWPVPVRLLDAPSGWGRLTGSLGGQLLPWSLASSRLSGCLLGTGHACVQSACACGYDQNPGIKS